MHACIHAYMCGLDCTCMHARIGAIRHAQRAGRESAGHSMDMDMEAELRLRGVAQTCALVKKQTRKQVRQGRAGQARQVSVRPQAADIIQWRMSLVAPCHAMPCPPGRARAVLRRSETLPAS